MSSYLGGIFMTEELADVHAVGVPLILFLGLVVVIGIAAAVSSKQKANAPTLDEDSALVATLCLAFGGLTFILSLPFLFNNNWAYGACWAFFGILSIGSGLSRSFPTSLVSCIGNLIGFFQITGTFFIITMDMTNFVDRISDEACEAYYDEAVGNKSMFENRCEENNALITLRVLSLIICVFQFLSAYFSAQMAGAVHFAQRI